MVNGKRMFLEDKKYRLVSIMACLLPELEFKGTGTRDLIWLKVVSLDRSWLVGLTGDH